MLRRFKGFIEEKQGSLHVASALLMVPIIATFGAAMDYSKFSNQVSSIQQALDAAGLATGRHMSTGANEEQLGDYAEVYFENNLNQNIETDTIDFTFSLDAGDSSVEPAIPTTITLNARLAYETTFGGFLDLDEMISDITSKIALGNRTVEIALVMDNSGSMNSNDRIGTMQDATKELVQTIFNASALTDLPDPVKFSVVPFSATVNIGTGNWNKKYMDRKGWSSIAHENFDWNTYATGNLTRFKYLGFQEKISGSWDWLTRIDVLAMMGVDWGGCVEMRPWPYSTTDEVVFSNQGFNSVVNSMDADGDGVNDGNDALFVHYFAPDEPDGSYAYKDGSSTFHYWDDDSYTNSYLYDWEFSDGSQIWENVHEASPVDPYDEDDWDKQINRTNWMFKYQNAQIDTAGANANTIAELNLRNDEGPNDGCRTTEITKLTTNKITVDTAIDAMAASGTTNIQQGLTWGWRTLSDNEPFTNGREDDDDQNIKYIILLTDGNNFYGTDGDSTPNQTRYGAWGYARTSEPFNPINGEDHNRWIDGLSSSDVSNTIYSSSSFDMTPESNGDFELIMNAHTNQACNNVKADGISIFTIAFDVASGSSVKYLLEECSGTGTKNGHEVIVGGTFYYDVNGGELEQAMANIANQIADMRIVQ